MAAENTDIIKINSHVEHYVIDFAAKWSGYVSEDVRTPEKALDMFPNTKVAIL